MLTGLGMPLHIVNIFSFFKDLLKMVWEICQGEFFMHVSDKKYSAKIEESCNFFSVHY